MSKWVKATTYSKNCEEKNLIDVQNPFQYSLLHRCIAPTKPPNQRSSIPFYQSSPCEQGYTYLKYILPTSCRATLHTVVSVCIAERGWLTPLLIIEILRRFFALSVDSTVLGCCSTFIYLLYHIPQRYITHIFRIIERLVFQCHPSNWFILSITKDNVLSPLSVIRLCISFMFLVSLLAPAAATIKHFDTERRPGSVAELDDDFPSLLPIESINKNNLKSVQRKEQYNDDGDILASKTASRSLISGTHYRSLARRNWDPAKYNVVSPILSNSTPGLSHSKPSATVVQSSPFTLNVHTGILLAGIITFVCVLLLLVSCCVYRKRNRKTRAAATCSAQEASLPPKVTAGHGSNNSSTIEYLSSSSKLDKSGSVTQAHTHNMSLGGHCLKYCCWCLRTKRVSGNANDGKSTNSVITTCPAGISQATIHSSTDLPSREGYHCCEASTPELFRTSSEPKTVPKSSLSLSIVNRRNAMHLSPLLPPITTIVSCSSPPIETLTIPIQPSTTDAFRLKRTLDTCAGIGSITTSHVRPLMNPNIAVEGPCFGNTKVVGSHENLPLAITGAIYVHHAKAQSTRNRTRGLLESRRGSHTSLTLSLSPSADSPIQRSTNVGRGVSLEEDSGTILELELGTGGLSKRKEEEEATFTRFSMCYSARSTHSEDPSSNCFESFPPSHAETMSELATDSLNPCGTVATGLLEPPDFQLVPHSQRQPSCPHHYHHHYRCRYHHSSCYYCRADLRYPCSHGSHVYHHYHQRGRDLEQLYTASQPLTCEEIRVKLKENTSTLFVEFWDIPMNHASKKDLPIAGIVQKNRYQTIFPNFNSRVELPMVNDDPTSTYINANYIHGYADRPNAFIATQGPMSHTAMDFWRMVWHTGAPAIVMITKLVEKRCQKCELYLPKSNFGGLTEATPEARNSSNNRTTASSYGSSPLSSSTSPSIYTPGSSCSGGSSVATGRADSGAISLEEPSEAHVDENVQFSDFDSTSYTLSPPGSVQIFGDLEVSVTSLERFHGYCVRNLVLRHKQNNDERKVVHFWYTAWSDHSSPETTPSSAKQLLQLVHAVESCRRYAEPRFSQEPVTDHNSPITTSDEACVSSSTLYRSAKLQRSRKSSYSRSLKGFSAITAAPLHRFTTPTTCIGSQQQLEPDVKPDEPIIVHCSAGLGRTGCFIALCIGCVQLMTEKVVDVLRIVSRMRLDRGGMVQTNDQYEFIHHALAAFPTYLQ